jgi:outer membrane protein insertion porin family
MMVEYDTRNDRMSPSKGWNARVSMEYAGLGGDFHYLRSMNYLRYYKNLFWDVVLRTNFNFDAITKADDRDIPFNQLFLLGGQNTLRGYKNRSIGLRKFSQYQYDQQLSITPGINLSLNEKNSWRPYGNLQQAYANIETEFPLIKEAGIKGVFFYDVGTAADAVLDGDLYSNLGLGFRWTSPIGPLRFEWGFPLKKDRFVDENYQFNFSIWQPF